jgi:hypothetical protein
MPSGNDITDGSATLMLRARSLRRAGEAAVKTTRAIAPVLKRSDIALDPDPAQAAVSSRRIMSASC